MAKKAIPPIALQLYTVRDVLTEDFAGTIQRVAEMGYEHVEFPSLYGHSPEEVRKLCDDNGLTIAAEMTGPEPLRDDVVRYIDNARILGNRHVVCAYLPESMRNAEGYREAVEIFSKAGRTLSEHGLTLCYHNHAFEFEALGEGSVGFEIIYQTCSPAHLKAELDVCWLKCGGRDPAAVVREFSGRAPLLHIKDMAEGPERTFTEVGNGILDMKAIVQAACDAGTEYLIIEQDANWAGGPMASAAQSLEGLRRVASEIE
jgi:sugar phosphate isomerase/epimerase